MVTKIIIRIMLKAVFFHARNDVMSGDKNKSLHMKERSRKRKKVQ